MALRNLRHVTTYVDGTQRQLEEVPKPRRPSRRPDDTLDLFLCANSSILVPVQAVACLAIGCIGTNKTEEQLRVLSSKEHWVQRRQAPRRKMVQRDTPGPA